VWEKLIDFSGIRSEIGAALAKGRENYRERGGKKETSLRELCGPPERGGDIKI